MASNRREAENIEDEIADNALKVIGDDTTSEQRARALLDTKQLAERRGRLSSEIKQLEKDKVRYERELNEYRNRVAYLP